MTAVDAGDRLAVLALVDGLHVADLADPPKVRVGGSREMTIWSADELRQFLAGIGDGDHPHATVVDLRLPLDRFVPGGGDLASIRAVFQFCGTARLKDARNFRGEIPPCFRGRDAARGQEERDCQNGER